MDCTGFFRCFARARASIVVSGSEHACASLWLLPSLSTFVSGSEHACTSPSLSRCLCFSLCVSAPPPSASVCVSRKRTVDGVPTSLLDLGYDYAGLDDGWQSCGAGINGSFHTKDGTPIVNTTKFPSLYVLQ